MLPVLLAIALFPGSVAVVSFHREGLKSGRDQSLPWHGPFQNQPQHGSFQNVPYRSFQELQQQRSFQHLPQHGVKANREEHWKPLFQPGASNLARRFDQQSPSARARLLQQGVGAPHRVDLEWQRWHPNTVQPMTPIAKATPMSPAAKAAFFEATSSSALGQVKGSAAMMQLNGTAKSEPVVALALPATSATKSLDAQRKEVLQLRQDNDALERTIGTIGGAPIPWGGGVPRQYEMRAATASTGTKDVVMRITAGLMFGIYAVVCLTLLYFLPRITKGMTNTILKRNEDAGQHLMKKYISPVHRLPTEEGQFSPSGNIFRLMARECESYKHHADCQQQLQVIAYEFKDLLADGQQPTDEELYNLLVEKFQEKLEKEVKRLNVDNDPMKKILPYLTDRVDVVFRNVLVPRDPDRFQRWMKDRAVAALVMVIMIAGPILIIVSTWFAPENVLKNGMSMPSNVKVLFCTSSVEVLATLFLVAIFEIVRQAVYRDIQDFDKLKYLPADTTWLSIGQLSNMLCMLGTVIGIPLVFFGEMMAKDIVFDSMGMLFIFAMDDITGDIFQYMNADNDSFQHKYMQFVDSLEDLPIMLNDLVNKDAQSADEIWSFALVDHKDTYKFCSEADNRMIYETRFMHKHNTHFCKDEEGGWQIKQEDGDGDALRIVGTDKLEVQYAVWSYANLPADYPRRFARLDKRPFQQFMRVLWLGVYFVLLLGEFIVPIGFMIIDEGSECYESA